MWTEKHSRIFGLNQKEVAILNAASRAPRTISFIANESKLPRTSLLYAIEKLNKRGLINPIGYGLRRKWRSVNAENFVNQTKILLRGSEDAGILKIPISHKSSITIYRGTNNMLDVFRKMAHLHKNERWYGMQPNISFQSAMRKYDMSDILAINKEFKLKKHIIEGIVHEKNVYNTPKNIGLSKAKDVFKSFIGRLEDYVSIPDDFLDVHSEIYIFRNTSVIMSPEKEIAIEIEDEDITAMIKAMFIALKEHVGQRYNQSELMKRFTSESLS